MDWSKAKSYLILTFLLLDILLGYQYYTAREQAQEYVQSFSSQLQELKDLLRERHMVLQTDVPKDTPMMSFLQVSHLNQNVRQIVDEKLHDPQVIEDDRSKGRMKFLTAEGEFVASSDGYFSMKYAEPLRFEADSAKFGANILAAITPTVWHSERYREDIISKDRSVVWYLQSYDKYPIFSAILEVHLQNSQIIGYNQKALEIGAVQDDGQRVLSAIQAVRSVAESPEPWRRGTDPNTTIAIKDIKLGYYSQNYADADVWYLAPMWRIVTDQKVYFVNAFTGQVEKGSP